MPPFTPLARFKQIFVTGPQRSGTTIAAKMIAADTGFRYVDEDEFLRDRIDMLSPLLADDTPSVIHCPALCRFVHELADDASAVVLMRRDIAAIVASQRRINWRAERIELRRYGLQTGVIAEVKYRFWESAQRDRVSNAFELDYECLAGHPLWVDPSRRRKFGPRQTAEDFAT